MLKDFPLPLIFLMQKNLFFYWWIYPNNLNFFSNKLEIPKLLIQLEYDLRKVYNDFTLTLVKDRLMISFLNLNTTLSKNSPISTLLNKTTSLKRIKDIFYLKILDFSYFKYLLPTLIIKSQFLLLSILLVGSHLES